MSRSLPADDVDVRQRAASYRREFAIALPLSLAGVLGALPGKSGAADPIAFLIWLSLWSLPAGWISGASAVRLWPVGISVPAVWMAVIALLDAFSSSGLPTPAWAALAWTGFYCVGSSLGTLWTGHIWSGAGALLLLAAALAGLPSAGGLSRAPWPPLAAKALLDVSPATLVVESAGVSDWMWHPAVYGPVGTDRFQRAPYRGQLAGPVALLVGCLAAALSSAAQRARPVPGLAGARK